MTENALWKRRRHTELNDRLYILYSIHNNIICRGDSKARAVSQTRPALLPGHLSPDKKYILQRYIFLAETSKSLVVQALGPTDEYRPGMWSTDR